jgi:hypothetical protein
MDCAARQVLGADTAILVDRTARNFNSKALETLLPWNFRPTECEFN